MMKKLFRSLTAAMWALCLGICAHADLLPIEEEPIKPSVNISTILIVAIAVIAFAVLLLILRHRRR